MSQAMFKLFLSGSEHLVNVIKGVEFHGGIKQFQEAT